MLKTPGPGFESWLAHHIQYKSLAYGIETKELESLGVLHTGRPARVRAVCISLTGLHPYVVSRKPITCTPEPHQFKFDYTQIGF